MVRKPSRLYMTRGPLRKLESYQRVRGSPRLELTPSSVFSNLRRFRPTIQVRRIK